MIWEIHDSWYSKNDWANGGKRTVKWCRTIMFIKEQEQMFSTVKLLIEDDIDISSNI